ncbi:hypothetical protein Bbelb_356870 [Branchiostoma belcheri]|nr:hypothetical protein Bbelb_356870 [Branchiostoma belcheri]
MAGVVFEWLFQTEGPLVFLQTRLALVVLHVETFLSQRGKALSPSISLATRDKSSVGSAGLAPRWFRLTLHVRRGPLALERIVVCSFFSANGPTAAALASILTSWAWSTAHASSEWFTFALFGR